MLNDRSTKRAFHPQVQVIIEVERPQITVDSSGNITRTGGRLLVLDEEAVTDASANMGIAKSSDATFTVANPRDKWFNTARKLNQLTKRQKEVSDYLLETLKISTVAERNDKRKERFWELLRDGKITRKALEQATKFGELTENGRFADGEPPTTRELAYSLYEYFSPELDLMNRVWINFADRNSTPKVPSLVAGFSGFGATITKNRSPGQHGTVTIRCRGLLSLLQRSEIVLAQAVDQRFEPLSGENIRETDMQPLSNALAGLTGIEIIERCVNRTQDVFTFNSGSPQDIAAKTADDYFYQDKLWQLQGDVFPVPDGSELVSNVGFGSQSAEALNPARTFVAGETTTERLNGKLIIDPELLDNSKGQFDIFKKAIRQSFKVYQNTNQMAYSLCREVADTIGYDFYDDPRGNIVFQVPKYDLLPRLRGELGITAEDRIPESGAAQLPRFGEDYSDIPFHGRDYIIDAIGDLGLRETATEESLVNYVLATGEPHWFTTPEGTQKYLTRVGTTSPALLLQELGEVKSTPTGVPFPTSEEALRVRRLIRRFGVRRHNLRTLITGLSSTNFLTRYAYQHLVRINAGIHTATQTLNQRPDIWPGRTVMLVEAQKLGYVVGTSNSFNKSARSNHSTTLTLAYMHHPEERIGVPWVIATDNVQSKEAEVDENLLYDLLRSL